ncbi:uncharacterized protein LOC113494674 [Trichoplusia ni]|uniref:Uncharacterized protein LOC113494674 n=1 Tax=Trichoplusia ni TaxID=7111 RepID=A0A7E5VKN5_TRINI|nr:uncharacterized protein LOC113494674 [Trichoplusia ni]
MPSIFSKNCIVAGRLDLYCLICEAPFGSEEEAIHHIVETHHKRRLNSTKYFEKYEDHLIKKIKCLYFCEFCNVTLPTAMKVELHITDCDHIKEKSLYKICRINNRIVASGCITIQDDAWHGLVDENCVICSVEISEKEPHITSRNHVLNLIKNNVLFDNPGTVYRQIDDGFYQCINCNIMLSTNELFQHFRSLPHTDLMLKVAKHLNCDDETLDLLVECTTNTKSVSQNTTENGRDIETIAKKDRETLPFPTGMKSNGSEKTTLFTEPVLRNGKDEPARPSSPSPDHIEAFAKKHGLSPNRADGSYYCKVCTRRLPDSLKSLKVHVNSEAHKEKVSTKDDLETLPIEPKKVPLETFIKEIGYFEDDVSFAVAVNNIFMTAGAFTMVKEFSNKLICLTCHIDLVREKLFQHVSSKAHGESLRNCRVVTSLKDEFIRQINNEHYLCGYCNNLEDDWEDMLDHLKSQKHKFVKTELSKLMAKYKDSKYYQKFDNSNTEFGISFIEFKCVDFMDKHEFSKKN